jgi:polysaccharide export outer membrane protein
LKPLKPLLAALFLTLCALSFGQYDEENYRLQPEDVVRIMVYNQQDLAAVVMVGPNGNITAPFLGIVKAEGKTTDELASELADLYKTKLGIRDPIVSVTMEAFRRIRATVAGRVINPGVYDMRPGDTVLTLFTRAGGDMRDNSADLRRATLRHKGSNEQIPIDLFAMTNFGDMSQNYEVKDGDELLVPEEQNNRIIVIGRIQSPGVYPFKESMKLMDAIAMSRGEIEYRSKLSKVTVTRAIPGRPGEYMQIQANLVDFMNKGDSSQNISLKPGDIVEVPDSGNINFSQVTSVANILFILDRFGFRLTPLGGF